MATKLGKEQLGLLFRQLLGEHSPAMMDIANQHVGQPVEVLIDALKEEDQKIAVKFTSVVIKELERMGVDLSSVWSVLEASELTEWSNPKQ
jgi:hypothetical protein